MSREPGARTAGMRAFENPARHRRTGAGIRGARREAAA
jgi:hypothetical protein